MEGTYLFPLPDGSHEPADRTDALDASHPEREHESGRRSE